MSTHNLCFYGEISKIITNYHQIPTLSVPLQCAFNFSDSSNASAQPSSRARSVAICLKLPLAPYIVWANSESYGQTAWMCRLAWAFTVGIFDKHHFHMSQRISFSDIQRWKWHYLYSTCHMGFFKMELSSVSVHVKKRYMTKLKLIYWKPVSTLVTRNIFSKWATSWQNQQNDLCAQRRQISLGIRWGWSKSSLCVSR